MNAIKKYNSVVVLTPMVYALGLSGCRLLVFAYIHGFCKDGASSCYASFKFIAGVVGYAERTVKEAVANLVADGYITKNTAMGMNGHKVNSYISNFFELMDRYDAGEDVAPTLLKTRRGLQKSMGAQCAPVHNGELFGAQSAQERVHKTAEKGAQSAPNYNKIINNNLSDSAQARETEEREFYKIFFLRNAADPEAEVRRFVGYYQSKAWTSADGRRYDTPEKRAGLAHAWDFKGESRLPKGPQTDEFYRFLGDLYAEASDVGGVDTGQILDARTKYEINLGGYYWWCRKDVARWVNEHRDAAIAIKNRTIGDKVITFQIY